MATDESKRRKDNCESCQDFKPIKAKNMCQNCWHKTKRRTIPKFYLSTRYTEMNQRCNNINYKRSDIYYGKKLCTREQFINRFLNDEQFLKLFDQWKVSGYDAKLAPSIDRINVKGDYTLDNIEFITHSANATKDQPMTEIDCYTKDKIFLRTYPSQGEAARALGVPQSNIWKVLNKIRNSAGGYYFEYSKT